MWRNYAITALRNISRNRLYAAINILGLTIGFAAAIFAALYVCNELTYDRWIPDHLRIYGVATTVKARVVGLAERDDSHRDAAAWLEADFPEVEATTRYLGQSSQTAVLRRGDVRAIERHISSADPNFFSVVRFPAIAGDLLSALDQPDSIVLTRGLARKYFGRDTPVGEALDLNEHPLRVTAVIEDLPANTTFTEQAFISARAPFSSLGQLDAISSDGDGNPGRLMGRSLHTLLRLKPGAQIGALEVEMPRFVARHLSPALFPDAAMRFYPLVGRHLFSFKLADDGASNLMRKRDQLLTAIYGIAAIGVLTVIAAAFNFINATTARASRRAVEVGVRKASGAEQRQLTVQFIGEAMIYAALGMVAAIALAAVLLPRFQAVLGQPVLFAPWRDAPVAAGMTLATVLVGVLAGAYPAFVLSAMRPARVLRTGLPKVGGSGLLRQCFVVAQFAILIGVAVIATVIARQTSLAMNENLRFDKDQVVSVQRACARAMEVEIGALPGVKSVGCSPIGGTSTRAVAPDGSLLGEWTELIDFGFFSTLGIKPLAGRFFSPEFGEDVAGKDASVNPNLVINETAAQKLGFVSPADAIGTTLSWHRAIGPTGAADQSPLVPSRIIGVMADISALHGENVFTHHIPRMYYVDLDYPGRPLLVKLTGRDVPETLNAIDAVWNRLGDRRLPIQRSFLDQSIEAGYRGLRQQQIVMTAFTSVALFIAALGLFGLSAFAAERRTKEVGIRKAMGASKGEILRLFLWDLGKPVAWANLIAWPAAYLVSRYWLDGFVHHIDLAPWMFLAASALALIIAVATVIGHALLVARAKPVTALRYE